MSAAAAYTCVLEHLPHHALLEQAGFRKELVREVAAFVLDARAFRSDWELQGPMVPGLDPMEAVDRLKKFQQLFEVRMLWHDLEHLRRM